MKKKQTHTETPRHTLPSYYENLAYALTAYAATNDTFYSWLYHTIPEQAEQGTLLYKKLRASHTITIPNERYAVRKTLWLIEQSLQKNLPTHQQILDTLYTWKQAQEVTKPEFIILGLTMTDAPFGLVGKPDKKHHPMDIIVSAGSSKKINRHTFAQTATSLSHEVLQKSILRAKGDIRNIEPELADWFFGEKEVVFHYAPLLLIDNLEKELQLLGTSYATRKSTIGVKYLAISPEIQLQDLENTHNIVTIN